MPLDSSSGFFMPFLQVSWLPSKTHLVLYLFPPYWNLKGKRCFLKLGGDGKKKKGIMIN